MALWAFQNLAASPELGSLIYKSWPTFCTNPPLLPIPHPHPPPTRPNNKLLAFFTRHWHSGWDLLPYKGLVSFLSGISQVEITFHNVFLLLFSDVLSRHPVAHVNIRTPGAELAPRTTAETCQQACYGFLCSGNFGTGACLEISEITWGGGSDNASF